MTTMSKKRSKDSAVPSKPILLRRYAKGLVEVARLARSGSDGRDESLEKAIVYVARLGEWLSDERVLAKHDDRARKIKGFKEARK